MELSEYGKAGVYEEAAEIPATRKRYDDMMDRIDMDRMGKKQELKRNFRVLSIISFTCLMMGSWPFAICHPKAQKFISYLTGWLLTTSWLVGMASGFFLIGQLAQACISIANPSYVPQAWQVWLFVAMFAFAAGIANTVLAQYLALLEIVAAGLFVIAFAANLIVFWVMAPHNTASEVFNNFDNGAGWSNAGFGMLTAQLSVLYLLIGSDGAAHMSEEIQDASLNFPRGIWGSYLLGAVTGFVMLVTFCFAFTPGALESPTGFPFIQVYLDTTGSVGGAQALTAVLILLIFFGGANFMASASRQTFAFARDGGLPFSRHIAKIVSLQLIALFTTYLVSIGTLVYRRLLGPPLPERRWSLGRFGLAINIIALLYGLFALAFIVIPSVPNPTLQEMNWAPVIFVGILAFALVYYFAGGHRTFDGPVLLVKHQSNWGRTL
ncbi:hypothetical protein B0A55_06367 [Friedmanniomyces simplex]|uniref:Amino acid permease/ SLC12A domain-containing protein n=1 Tax=Friedmanniomyces simplex TaxID=329884 RepID=A0A4U0X6K7_9PEZI|nr:hypothetical protein B0A55_06367 [Friedmanniomyces simplex]